MALLAISSTLAVLLQAFYVMRYRQHDKYDPHMLTPVYHSLNK
jgi:hypothetical protein